MKEGYGVERTPGVMAGKKVGFSGNCREGSMFSEDMKDILLIKNIFFGFYFPVFSKESRGESLNLERSSDNAA